MTDLGLTLFGKNTKNAPANSITTVAGAYLSKTYLLNELFLLLELSVLLRGKKMLTSISLAFRPQIMSIVDLSSRRSLIFDNVWNDIDLRGKSASAQHFLAKLQKYFRNNVIFPRKVEGLLFFSCFFHN